MHPRPEHRDIPDLEVRLQLQRILKSPVFSGGAGFRKSTEAGLTLKYLVNEVLASREPDERSVLRDLFGRASKENKYGEPDRAASKRLGLTRDKLAEYYAAFGEDDLVHISIPIGQFGPIWDYKPDAPAHQLVLQGMYYTNRESPKDIAFALDKFEEAIKRAPSYAAAHAGKASALLTASLDTINEKPERFLSPAKESAAEAVKLDQNSWLGHLQLGAVSPFRHQWEDADLEYGLANEIRPLDVIEQGGYGPYLISRDKRDAINELIKTYSNRKTTVVYLRRAALYLYVLRDYSRSEHLLEELERMEQRYWLTHLLLAFNFLATDELQKASLHAQKLQEFSDTNTWPGFCILCLTASGKTDEAHTEYELLRKRSESGVHSANAIGPRMRWN